MCKYLQNVFYNCAARDTNIMSKPNNFSNVCNIKTRSTLYLHFCLISHAMRKNKATWGISFSFDETNPRFFFSGTTSKRTSPPFVKPSKLSTKKTLVTSENQIYAAFCLILTFWSMMINLMPFYNDAEWQTNQGSATKPSLHSLKVLRQSKQELKTLSRLKIRSLLTLIPILILKTRMLRIK